MRIQRFCHFCWGLLPVLSMLLLALPVVAGAVGDGFYLGFSAGQSTIFAKATTVNGQSAKADKNDWGERLYLGGQFNPHAAIEAGYTHYGSAAYNVLAPSGNKPAVRVYGLDFNFRLMWPFENGFSIFGMPGFAIAHASRSGSLVGANGSRIGTKTSFRPEAGFGVSYDITQRWVGEVSFRHLFGSGLVPSANLLALGISYHFSDEMCGQFLC